MLGWNVLADIFAPRNWFSWLWPGAKSKAFLGSLAATDDDGAPTMATYLVTRDSCAKCNRFISWHSENNRYCSYHNVSWTKTSNGESHLCQPIGPFYKLQQCACYSCTSCPTRIHILMQQCNKTIVDNTIILQQRQLSVLPMFQFFQLKGAGSHRYLNQDSCLGVLCSTTGLRALPQLPCHKKSRKETIINGCFQLRNGLVLWMFLVQCSGCCWACVLDVVRPVQS